jgi:hypothetical protein
MLVFLGAGFTDFVRPDLISIALLSEDGQEFYAERTNYCHADCSDFVRQTVQPLLGRVPGAACSCAEGASENTIHRSAGRVNLFVKFTK